MRVGRKKIVFPLRGNNVFVLFSINVMNSEIDMALVYSWDAQSFSHTKKHSHKIEKFSCLLHTFAQAQTHPQNIEVNIKKIDKCLNGRQNLQMVIYYTCCMLYGMY